ncbi:MAG: hypothetical protein ACFFG0_00090 [Candidatus Thorarchaeota archaeon]
MTQPKYISQALKGILENPVVQCILDRSCNLDAAIETVKSWWGYNLMTRKPSSAYDQYGIFKGTDLDLACFLYELSGRGAVINIPTYKAQSRSTKRKDQQLASKFNRNGKVVGVEANKNFFSFSVKIIDQNVIGEDSVGDFRNFSLTDKLGDWYSGWQRIEFTPTLKENRFITENNLWTGNKIIFKNFIHPNRWTSFFGHHYVITKMLMERIEDECKFLNTEVKRMQAAGIEFPEGEGPGSFEREYGEGVQKTFPAFEAKIYIPSTKISGDYTMVDEMSAEVMVEHYNRRKKLLYSVLPALRFMTRASEYAHYKNPERMPAWIKNVKWEDGFKIPPRGRVEWQRLKLVQPAVGEHSISILKRSFEKSATVGAD